MDTQARPVIHSSNASSLVDVLERILDKGIVVTGDITLKIVDIELLTIQIRLLVCSVDKAREMGMNWWMTNAYVGTAVAPPAPQSPALLEEANPVRGVGAMNAASQESTARTAGASSSAAIELSDLAERISALEGTVSRVLLTNPSAGTDTADATR